MLTRTRLLLVLAALPLVVFASALADNPTGSSSKEVEVAQQLITPQKLKMHLSIVASDEFEGRGTPSRGLDLAARYLASHMEYYGYAPAGDEGSFYQKISMSRRKPSKESRLVVTAGGQTEEFKVGVDFLGGGKDAQGQLVFAGYGVVSKALEYDDYAGLDVKDKLVVVFDGFPAGTEARQFQEERKAGSRTFRVGLRKWLLAQNKGAVGTITIKGPEYTAAADGQPSPFQRELPNLDRESPPQFDFHRTNRPTSFDVSLTAEAAARLQKVLGIDLAAIKAKIDETKKPNPVTIDATFQSEFKTDVVEQLSTQNVIAFLEGSDPQLKEEIVAFSAHYDHLGTPAPRGAGPRPAAPGGDSTRPRDAIYNGADDDGTGTVGILSLAEAFAAVKRPRRSLMFIWHAGEEIGLVGSDYFVQHPTRPLDKMVALVNIDMIGRNFGDRPENADHVYLVGAARTSRDLRDILFKVNRDRIRFDESDNANYFQRSDHFNYARHKIPVVFFCTGEHKDYHRVSDEVQHILFDKMKTILDIAFEAGLELANRDTRPAFSGTEF